MTEPAAEPKPVDAMTRKELEQEAAAITDKRLFAPPSQLSEEGLRSAVRSARRRNGAEP